MAPTPPTPGASAAVGGQPLLRADDTLAMCDMLIGDLTTLLEESRRQEGFGSQLQSLFVHSDAPSVRDLCSEALTDLQKRKHSMSSVEPIRKSLLYLRPFIAACEQKHQRLIPAALTSIVKLVQRKLISHEGRCEILTTLVTRVEKTRDERALLSALQICLALLQDPSYADDEQGIGQLLSLVLRIHDTHAGTLPTVAHTAASTVRQAVALIFDHAMLPVDQVGVSLSHNPHLRGGGGTPRGGGGGIPAAPLPPAPVASILSPRASTGMYKDLDGLSGREVAALKLLRDLISWAQGSDRHGVEKAGSQAQPSVQWLACKPPFPEFLLDLLEVILRERAAAFHVMPRFTVALRNEVCATLGVLLRAALAERLPPPETIRVLRCVSALLRKHVNLAPDKCALFFQELLACMANANIHVLVRCHVLDICRAVCAEPLLTYRLFTMYDQAMEFDLNAVADMLAAGVRYADALLRRAADPHNPYRDEYLSRLDGYYHYRTAEGKDPALTVMEAHSTSIENSADADVLPAYLSLDLVAGLASSLEQLAVRVRGADEIAAAAGPYPDPVSLGNLETPGAGVRTSGAFRRSADAMSGAVPYPAPPVLIHGEVVATMVDCTWRPISSCLDAYLQTTDKRSENCLTLPLVTAYQYIIYAAGVVHAQTALNGLLSQLCAFAITGPEDKAWRDAIARAPQHEGGLVLPNTLSMTCADTVELWPKNRTVLKAVLELTKRLAEDLGSGWLHVLDTINCLDRYLDHPGAKWRNENDRPEEGYRRRLDLQGEPDRERVKPGTGKDLLKEKEQWRAACDEVFVTSARLSDESVVGLMAALYEVSRLTLSDSWRPYQEVLPLDMLRQAQAVLTANLHLTQELWGIFLSHCMLVLRSVNERARASALRALDEGIMRALSPEAVVAARAAAGVGGPGRGRRGRAGSTGPAGSPYTPAYPIASPFTSRQASAAGTGHLSSVADAAVEAAAAAEAAADGVNEDIQNLLLVAVDGLFQEHGKLDVQLGLLRIVVHVLQHYGEDLTRGWVPLLRLLEAASSCKEPALVTLGWQCVEMLASDYLYMLPKEHVNRALDVLALYARQDQILNVSLTAVTMLWNVADTLARSKGVTARSGPTTRAVAPAAATPGTPPGAAAVVIAASAVSEFDAGLAGAVVSTNDRRDVTEEESVSMLLVAFRALKALALDARPEVRNSAIRTLFMAMGSHAGRFPMAGLRECTWELALPLLDACHHLSQTSSSVELGPSEIGKDKEGKVVTMLMHHSRNTEQKQWEESLGLAVAGVTKVLRTHLPAISQLQGWQAAWEQLMQVVGQVLSSPRKGLATACTGMITTLVATHAGSPAVFPPWTWRAALAALDKGVIACSAPGAAAPLQVRTELLACITVVHAGLRDQLTAPDVRLILSWLDRFGRYPFGADDTPYLSAGLTPIQKATLTVLHQLAPPPPGVWPDLLATLCAMLCPFRVLPFRTQAPSGGAIPTGTSASAFAAPPRGVLSSLQSGGAMASPGTNGAAVLTGAASSPSSGDRLTPSAASTPTTARGGALPADLPGLGSPAGSTAVPDALATEARALSSAWMARIAELASAWYKEQVPWQVRVVTFPTLVSSLSECMAMRHVDAGDELWRSAAQAFVAVVQSGLPSINVAAHSQLANTAAAPSPTPPLQPAAASAGAASALPATSGSGGAADATWGCLVRAFEMFLLGRNLPGPLPPGRAPNAALGTTRVLLPLPSSIMERSLHAEGPPPAPPMGPSDVEVQAAVLDCLADSVLTSCQYAPPDARAALVGIIDAGAAASTPGEAALTAGARFSHACLSKLYVLCSRGWDAREPRSGGEGRTSGGAVVDMTGLETSHASPLASAASGGLSAYLTRSTSSLVSRLSGGDGAVLGSGGAAPPLPKDQNARCLQDVAQIALPIFLSRCETVLRAFVYAERSSGAFAGDPGSSGAGAWHPPPMDPLLADRAVHVLDLLASLRVCPTVMDGATAARPELRAWVDAVRALRAGRRSSGAGPAGAAANATAADGLLSGREQLHLLPFFGLCAELVVSGDVRVRGCVRGLLLALGKELGLPSGLDPS